MKLSDIFKAIISFFTALFAKKEIPQSQETGNKEQQLELPTYLPLSWSKKIPQDVTDYLFKLIDDNWPVLKTCKDWHIFRSDWSELTEREQKNVVAEFIAQLTLVESSWNPASSSVDVGKVDDPNTHSVGLLQMSVVDQVNYAGLLKMPMLKYLKDSEKLQAYTLKDLMTAKPNLHLGITIMVGLIKLDGKLTRTTYVYWAPLKPGGKYDSIAKIAAAVNKFPIKANRPKPTTPITPPSEMPVNPAYIEAKKYIGKSEHDPKFNAWLSKFWPKAGLPSYKTIVGSGFAWCMLFIVAMQTEVGQKTVVSAMAHDSRLIGVGIDFKNDGIPEGAFLWINNSGDCRVAAEDDHTTMAAGSCTPEDVAKPGSIIPALGGNQGDAVKKSPYCIKGDCKNANGSKNSKKICAVRWPAEGKKPGKVTKSVNCGGSTSNESTR